FWFWLNKAILRHLAVEQSLRGGTNTSRRKVNHAVGFPDRERIQSKTTLFNAPQTPKPDTLPNGAR
ncbi:hypothetical protein LK486_18050, partial [Fusicatenibacter saccharivorans]|nr:hypothetical protein [Fusicatenibacter saccharivorans]